MNLRKNEGFPTCIPCIPIPEYGQSNAPLIELPDIAVGRDLPGWDFSPNAKWLALYVIY